MKKLGDPVYFEEAYSELTNSAFSAFVRLMAEKDDTFPRPKIHKILEKSKAQSDRILRELRLVGYIKIKNMGNGKSSIVKIFRRLRVRKGSKFAIF